MKISLMFLGLSLRYKYNLDREKIRLRVKGLPKFIIIRINQRDKVGRVIFEEKKHTCHDVPYYYRTL